MAAQAKPIRFPAPLLAEIETAAERNGRTFSGEVLATLAERYLGADAPEPAAPKAQPRPAKPNPAPADVPGVRRASEIAAPEGGKVSMSAAMDRAGIAQWGDKRAPYQKKGQGAQVKKR